MDFRQCSRNSDLDRGDGYADPGSEAVESTAAEVDAVVEAVLEHATTTPERSLAVVALNSQHAEKDPQPAMRTIGAEPGSLVLRSRTRGTLRGC